MTAKATQGLAELYALMARQARQSGKDKQLKLKNGARLCVRVQTAKDGDVTTLSIARRGKAIGTGELDTFRVHCQIPPEATRWPASGQHERTDAEGVMFYQVVYRWKTVEGAEA